MFPLKTTVFFLVSGSIPVPIFKPNQHERNHPGHCAMDLIHLFRLQLSMQGQPRKKRFRGPSAKQRGMVFRTERWWVIKCPHGSHHPTMNGIWSMPWLRCPIYPKWDSYQPLKDDGEFVGLQRWMAVESMAMQQEPDWLEVPIPYIFGLFVRPKFQEISPEFLWPEKWYIQYLHFRRRSPIDRMVIEQWRSRDGFMGMGWNMVLRVIYWDFV